jgi:hypothetical protein
MFYYSRDRAGEHPQRHLADYAGIFQADAFYPASVHDRRCASPGTLLAGRAGFAAGKAGSAGHYINLKYRVL